MTSSSLSPGDDWHNHYRGFSFQVSPNGEVWWQLYNGTDRLQLTPPLTAIAEGLLELKRIGGRIHITENGDVLTRLEADDGSYDDVYVGEVDPGTDLAGQLVPEGDSDHSLDLQPSGLSAGDLWPSVYDGSRYSFVGERVWWHNGSTHKRHPVSEGLPTHIHETLNRFKSRGGSFRITPWGDVITLVSIHPAPGDVAEQFATLPRVVQNIIKLRKERGVEMLPVYIGNLDGASLTVEEPASLTDDLTDEEQHELASWAENLGRTTTRSASVHKAKSSDEGKRASTSDGESPGPQFEDDPMDWIEDDIEGNED